MQGRFSVLIVILICAASLFLIVPVHADTTYTFYGPYYDNSAVANADVTITLFYANNSVYSFTLSGDGVTADSASIISTSELSKATWNASTVLNYTRVYDFESATDNTVYIHIPDTSLITYSYYFNIADFYGMTKAYLETQTSANGSTWVTVEKKIIDQGTLTFVLTQYYDYTLMITNIKESGSAEYYSLSFTPENDLYIDLPVLSGSFAVAEVQGAQATANRTSATNINLAYTDGDEITDWLYFLIYHEEGSFTIEDYELNLTDTDSYSFTWNQAESEFDYSALVQSSRAGYTYTWRFALPAAPESNPWAGKLDFLGSWPTGFDPDQIIAAGLCLLFLCIGSFKSAALSCALAWIVGGIFIAVGWWQPAIPIWGLGGFLVFIIATEEGKQTVREV